MVEVMVVKAGDVKNAIDCSGHTFLPRIQEHEMAAGSESKWKREEEKECLFNCILVLL